ncbi:MAG: archaemetzincin family Zn-dependent metalloprotease [Crenarchaeota archaeon]|nr:archaemetzincin family Zn-dependent metalloprotease [Thermoproteota archaeon]
MLKVDIISEIEIPDPVLEHIENTLSEIAPTEVNIVEDIDLTEIVEKFRDASRNQVNAEKLLNTLREVLGVREFNNKMVIVIDDDGYVPGLNFVFGVAELCGNIAIVFTHRLKISYLGDTVDIGKLFYERLTKEILHEIGHTLCLEHCPNKRCVMSFSNTIYDVDYKEAKYCKTCIEKARSVISWKKF